VALGLVNACAPVTRTGPAIQERGWRTYLGTDARAGMSRETLAADPQPVWRTDVGRGIAGGPALAEDVVAVGLVDRQVALLDRSTGDVLWRRRLGQHVGAGPLLTDDRLLVATQDDGGRVYALRLTDGRPLWTRPSGDVAAPLAVAGGVVYAGALDGTVSALFVEDGERRWRVRVSGAVRTAPVMTTAGLVVGTTTDSLFLLDHADGRVKARRATRGTPLAALAVAESLVLVGTMGGRLEGLDPATLAPRWTRQLDGGILGHVAVRDGRAWAVTTAGTLWIVPLDAPGAARSLAAGLVTRAGPAPVEGGVLLVGVGGELVLLDDAGRRRWTTRLGATVVEPPLVTDRTVIVVSQRGEVIAFR